MAEGSEHCVTMFSPTGERLRSFGTFSSVDGCLDPYGVAVDKEGNVLVTDLVDHCIQKFTAQGKLLAQVSIGGDGSSYPFFFSLYATFL